MVIRIYGVRSNNKCLAADRKDHCQHRIETVKSRLAADQNQEPMSQKSPPKRQSLYIHKKGNRYLSNSIQMSYLVSLLETFKGTSVPCGSRNNGNSHLWGSLKQLKGERKSTNTRWRSVGVAMKDDLPLGYFLQTGSKNEI